jgi:hypothetical protein
MSTKAQPNKAKIKTSPAASTASGRVGPVLLTALKYAAVALALVICLTYFPFESVRFAYREL